jgi:hypothetical protein
MTCHKPGPCKGSRKGHAIVCARVEPQISTGLQRLQAFGETLSHVYVRAHAGAHVRWFTHNPCNSCNPCTSVQDMADFRHSFPLKCARHPQGFAASCKGCPASIVRRSAQTPVSIGVGGGQNPGGVKPLDRSPSHAELFLSDDRFSGRVCLVTIAYQLISLLGRPRVRSVRNVPDRTRERPSMPCPITTPTKGTDVASATIKLSRTIGGADGGR